jgi:hypothetical protein
MYVSQARRFFASDSVMMAGEPPLWSNYATSDGATAVSIVFNGIGTDKAKVLGIEVPDGSAIRYEPQPLGPLATGARTSGLVSRKLEGFMYVPLGSRRDVRLCGRRLLPMTGKDSPDYRRLLERFSDRNTRMNGLYEVLDERGNLIPYVRRPAQQVYAEDHWVLDIIAKARQLGFSTEIAIDITDCCVFRKNFKAGIIDFTLDDAS